MTCSSKLAAITVGESIQNRAELVIDFMTGASETGTPIVAVFNISARPLTELIPLSCFPGTVPSLHYIVRAHVTGKTSVPIKIDGPTSLITTSLDVRGYEIFTAFHAVPFTAPRHGDIWVANLGLVNKMTGGVAIVNGSTGLKENGRVSVDVKLKALGVFGKLKRLHVPSDSTLTNNMVSQACIFPHYQTWLSRKTS